MKLWKRIGMFLLAVIVVFGALPLSYIKANAGTQYQSRLWIAGALAPHTCTANCLHLRGTDQFLGTVSKTDIVLISTDEESGVWLNDTDKRALWLIKTDGPTSTYLVGGISEAGVTEGTKVTIKGNFQCRDKEIYGGDTICFEETSFVFDGTMWIESAIVNEQAKLTLTGGNESGINTNATTGFAKDGSWNQRAYAVSDGASGVFVNGERKNVPLILLDYGGGAENHYFALSDAGVTATQDTRVVIKGNFVQGNHVVEFEPTVYTYNGSSWSKETFGVTGFSQVLIGNEGQWQIWINTEGTFAAEEGEMFTWPAILNDTNLKNGISVFKDGGKFYLHIWPGTVPSDGTAEATLVLKGADIIGSKGNIASLKNDITLCFNSYGVALNTPIDVDTSDVEFEVIQGAGGKTDIYLRPVEEDAFEIGRDVRPTAVTGGLQGASWYFPHDSNITIGEQVFIPQSDVEFVKHDWLNVSGDYFIKCGNTVSIEEGTTLTLKGLYLYNETLVSYRPTVLRWDGSKWVKLTTLTALAEGTAMQESVEESAEETEYQEIEFKILSLYEPYQTEGAWDLYLTTSETLEAATDEAYQGLQITVTNKSQMMKKNVTFYHAGHDGGTAFFRIKSTLLPQDIAEDTEVVIHAGTATSTSGKKMRLMKDCILQVNVSEKWSKPNYDGTKWEMHFETDGAFSGRENEVFFWPVCIDGEETQAIVTKENNQLVLRMSAVQFPTDGTEAELVIQKATVIGSEGSVICLATDTKLYVNRFGLKIGNPIVPDTENVGLTIMPAYTTKKHIYLHAFQHDVFPVDKTWSVRPVAANGYVDGVYYFEEQNGLSVDDTFYKPNITGPLVEFVKHDEFYNAALPETEEYREYFIGLQNVEDKITDGTIVRFQGLFLYEGKLVEYTPIRFIWSEADSAWNVENVNTHVSGDANGDGTSDVKDLVRMVKYLSHTGQERYEIPMNQVDGDLIMEEDFYKVDEVDLKELRLQFVDAAKIELAAYCGPRREGYRYYVDNDNDDGSDGNYDGNVNVEPEYGTHPEDPKEGFTGWITEKDFQDYKNCGFTYLLPEQDALYDFTYNNDVEPTPVSVFERSDLYSYMELAEKMNIPVVVHANSLTGMTMDTDGVLTDKNKQFLNELYGNLNKYKMFRGYSLADEPTYESVESFAQTKAYLEALNPYKSFYTACLPMSASKSLLSADATMDKEAAYRSYMDGFYTAIGNFMYDLYPLITHTSKGNSLDKTWFANLQLVAEHAKQNQYDPGIVVQSTSYGYAKNYKLQENPEHHRTIETKADVGFQVYTALAYGMKSINYYTYWTHWTESARAIDSSAMVNYPATSDGEPVKTNAYYAVKAINQEIKKFDHVFLEFDWQGTMALAPAHATMSEVLQGALKDGSNYEAKNMDATATEETIVGCMKDANGNDGYMIVNATEPSAGRTSKVTLRFKGAKKAVAYIEGTETTVTLQDGIYTLEVGAGEGVFIIPFS